MRNSLRFSIGAAAIAALAACSGSKQPTLSDDLKQDLAKAGGGDVQLASVSAPKLDVVSAAERAAGGAPQLNGPSVTKAPSAHRGARAVVKSKRKEAPVIAESPRSDATAVVTTEKTEVAPDYSPAPVGRPSAPRPSTQPEPRGGWKTMGDVIRNAPFPINP